MTPEEYASTRDYRDHLFRSLSVAKLRLSPSEFEMAGAGLKAELKRVEQALTLYRLDCVPICSLGGIRWNEVTISGGDFTFFDAVVSAALNTPPTSTPWARKTDVRRHTLQADGVSLVWPLFARTT